MIVQPFSRLAFLGLSVLFLVACGGGGLGGGDKFRNADNPTLTQADINRINAELSAVENWTLLFAQGQLHDANTSESGRTQGMYSSTERTGHAFDSIAFFADDRAGNPAAISMGVDNRITPSGVSGGWHRFVSGDPGGACSYLGFTEPDSSTAEDVTAHSYRLVRLSLYKEEIFTDRAEGTYDYGLVLADQSPLSFVVVPVFHRSVAPNPAASAFWPQVSVLDTHYDPSPERNFVNGEYASRLTCFGTTPAHPISELTRHITDYTKLYVQNQMADVPITNDVYQSNLFMIAHPRELWELRPLSDEVMALLEASAGEVENAYFDDYYPYARADITTDIQGTDADRYIAMKMAPAEIADRAHAGARTYCDRLGYTSLVGYDLTFEKNEGSQFDPRYVWDTSLNDWRAEYDEGEILTLNVLGFDVQMPMLYLHNIICASS